jgi:hypothetical protein
MNEYGPNVVRALMVEMADEDSSHLAVNNVLYARSATYQQALDFRLATAGFLVRNVGDGHYEILHASRTTVPRQQQLLPAEPPADPTGSREGQPAV